MPQVKCPFPLYDYETDDLDAAIVAALITTHSIIHNIAVKAEKVRRPATSSAGTSEDRSYFLSRWADYKSDTKLECCYKNLRVDLTRAQEGTLRDKPEADVYAAIRQLAVREENTMVARVALHNMRQDRDDISFGARLQGQANICNFVTKCKICDTDVNYTEEMMRYALSRGLSDPEIQMDLLCHIN